MVDISDKLSQKRTAVGGLVLIAASLILEGTVACSRPKENLPKDGSSQSASSIPGAKEAESFKKPPEALELYEVVYPFKKPEGSIEHFVLDNFGPVKYMQWARFEDNVTWAKSLGELYLEPTSSGNWKEFVEANAKGMELAPFISMETYEIYRISRQDYRGTRIPAKAIHFQIDQFGNKIKLDNPDMDAKFPDELSYTFRAIREGGEPVITGQAISPPEKEPPTIYVPDERVNPHNITIPHDQLVGKVEIPESDAQLINDVMQQYFDFLRNADVSYAPQRLQVSEEQLERLKELGGYPAPVELYGNIPLTDFTHYSAIMETTDFVSQSGFASAQSKSLKRVFNRGSIIETRYWSDPTTFYNFWGFAFDERQEAANILGNAERIAIVRPNLIIDHYIRVWGQGGDFDVVQITKAIDMKSLLIVMKGNQALMFPYDTRVDEKNLYE